MVLSKINLKLEGCFLFLRYEILAKYYFQSNSIKSTTKIIKTNLNESKVHIAIFNINCYNPISSAHVTKDLIKL